MDDIFELNHNDQEDFVLERSRSKPILLNFWAPWCEVNDSFRPRLEALARDYDIGLIHVNVDEKSGVAEHFDVRGVPDVKLLKDGREVDGFAGALPDVNIRKFLDKYIESPQRSENREESLG